MNIKGSWRRWKSEYGVGEIGRHCKRSLDHLSSFWSHQGMNTLSVIPSESVFCNFGHSLTVFQRREAITSWPWSPDRDAFWTSGSLPRGCMRQSVSDSDCNRRSEGSWQAVQVQICYRSFLEEGAARFKPLYRVLWAGDGRSSKGSC